MHFHIMLLWPLLLLIGGSCALPWDGVQPTKPIEVATYNPAPPRITAAVGDLRKRQQDGDLTCGYEDGISSAAAYCVSGHVCATNSVYAFACCESASVDNCPMVTTCIDSTALSKYDPSFLSKYDVGYCTEATAPLCVTKLYYYNPIATGWGCSSYKDTETYYTTITNGTTTSAVSVHNAVYFPPAATSSSSTTTSTTSTTSSSSTMVPPTPSPTPEPAASAPTPIGAIVGGTVGGLAVIGGLALLAFFLFRRSRRQNSAQPVYPEANTMQQTPGPTQPPPLAPYPEQSAYGYAGQSTPQSPVTAGPVSFPEKAPMQSTLPVHGSPEIASPVSMVSNDQRANTTVPPYSPIMSELGAPVKTVHELG